MPDSEVKKDQRIQVKDIVKEVKDYLKTYSSAGMDISWVDMMPNIDTTNTSPTINVSRSVVVDDLLLPRLLDSRGGSHIINDSDSDVKEDNRTSNEFIADLNVKHHERALLANQKRFFKRIDELTKGKNGKGKGDKGKNDKGLVAELFDWDNESVSSEDEGTTEFKTFMEIAEDEPSVGKSDARSGQWDESENQEPLPPLPKLTGVEPSGASKSLISLSDLTANMAELTLNTTSKKVKKSSDKISQTYVIKKKTEPKHPVSQNSCPDKNALPSTEQILLTLMEEVKACEKGKHHRATFKTKRSFSINKCLRLLHMDLFGPVKPQTISHNKYTMVIVDEYSKYTWVFFLKKKSDAVDCIMSFIRQIEKLNDTKDRWSREKHIELVNIIGEPLAGNTTRSRIKDSKAASAHECLYVNFLSEIEPKNLIKALKEEGWVLAMSEEMNQFERNKVWTLVPKPYGKTIIGLKWVFRNKMDEERVVTKNMARLVAKGFIQEKGIYYDETFATVSRLKAIRTFLAYASYMRFTVYQMDVKSAFLNGNRSEEVYVEQSLGLKAEKYVKDLLKKYDLADCASVKCPMLSPNNLGSDESGVSVNDIVQRHDRVTDVSGIQKDQALISKHTQTQTMLVVTLIKKFSEGCQILGGNLVCWSAKKQTSVAMSSAEAEYVAVAKCCAQVLWIKSRLADYDVLYDKSFTQKEFISAIGLSICKNLVPLPPKEIIRAVLATLGLFDKDKTTISSTVLVNSSPLKMKEVNNDDTVDKSLSRAFEQPVTQPKAPTDLKIKKKKIPSSSQPKSPYKVRFTLPNKQVAETQQAEVTVAIANATKSLKASELAVEQGNQPSAAEPKSQIPKLQDHIMHDSDEPADYESMPEDDLRSVSGFEAADSDDTQGNDVSHSDHTFPDHNASVERLSLPDHICKEVSSFHSKLGTMESSIIHQVSDGIKSTFPSLSDRFAKLETKLSKTLKSDMGKLVTTLVKSGMKEVRDDMKYQAKSLGKFGLDVQSMQTQLNDTQSLLESAVIVDDTAEGEKNKNAKDPNPPITHGEVQSAEPLVEIQGEQPDVLNVVNEESAPLASDAKLNEGK
nr:retrovirus-related Pol polyprotein from transposon TNT 1-94 [Tanacetum cinerariifolium]